MLPLVVGQIEIEIENRGRCNLGCVQPNELLKVTWCYWLSVMACQCGFVSVCWLCAFVYVFRMKLKSHSSRSMEKCTHDGQSGYLDKTGQTVSCQSLSVCPLPSILMLPLVVGQLQRTNLTLENNISHCWSKSTLLHYCLYVSAAWWTMSNMTWCYWLTIRVYWCPFGLYAFFLVFCHWCIFFFFTYDNE